MTQTTDLFRAIEPVTVFAATTSAPAAVQLPKAGETLRVVNTGDDAAYIAIADTAASAVAALPTNGSVISCYVGPGADITLSMLGDQQKFVSAIMAANTANILFYVGKGA
jgi:hypothetical protein